MIKAIAVDDEPLALNVIESFCKETGIVSLEKTFTRPDEAQRYISKFPVDLLFLDIQMPSTTGIDFYKSLERQPMVIFTTAYSDFAVEGFNLSAVDYLLKPFSKERFLQAVSKANDYYNYLQQNTPAEEQHMFLRADYSLIKLKFSDILYIEGLDDYLKIHVENQKTIVTRMTMKNILEKLPANDFVRVHRSFIVPVKRIEKVRSKTITVAGIDIPIGASFEETFFKVFKGEQA
ncbi:MAG: LytTR family DNA-binding domain-containing protein [Bacteroidia bacterium]